MIINKNNNTWPYFFNVSNFIFFQHSHMHINFHCLILCTLWSSQSLTQIPSHYLIYHKCSNKCWERESAQSWPSTKLGYPSETYWQSWELVRWLYTFFCIIQLAKLKVHPVWWTQLVILYRSKRNYIYKMLKVGKWVQWFHCILNLQVNCLKLFQLEATPVSNADKWIKSTWKLKIKTIGITLLIR